MFRHPSSANPDIAQSGVDIAEACSDRVKVLVSQRMEMLTAATTTPFDIEDCTPKSLLQEVNGQTVSKYIVFLMTCAQDLVQQPDPPTTAASLSIFRASTALGTTTFHLSMNSVCSFVLGRLGTEQSPHIMVQCMGGKQQHS